MNIKVMLLSVIIPSVMCSCDSTPEGVLGKSDMADVLVDIHKGEVVIDYERNRYNTDSMKMLMQESVYRKHGVTSAEVDSSLVWYGRHIEDYIDVYDDVIDRIENELASGRGQVQVFAEGDSIDVWPGVSHYRIDPSIPSNVLSFTVIPDANCRVGDNYMLQFKVVNNSQYPAAVRGNIYAEYGDSLLEARSSAMNPDGWFRLRFVSDSTLQITKIAGSIIFDLTDKETVYLDSVSLVRTRLGKDHYLQHTSNRRIRLNR